MAAKPLKSFTWRVSQVPEGASTNAVINYFAEDDQKRIAIRSLCPDVSQPGKLTATLLFKPNPDRANDPPATPLPPPKTWKSTKTSKALPLSTALLMGNRSPQSTHKSGVTILALSHVLADQLLALLPSPDSLAMPSAPGRIRRISCGSAILPLDSDLRFESSPTATIRTYPVKTPRRLSSRIKPRLSWASYYSLGKRHK